VSQRTLTSQTIHVVMRESRAGETALEVHVRGTIRYHRDSLKTSITNAYRRP